MIYRRHHPNQPLLSEYAKAFEDLSNNLKKAGSGNEPTKGSVSKEGLSTLTLVSNQGLD
jgi:hypothetical protein